MSLGLEGAVEGELPNFRGTRRRLIVVPCFSLGRPGPTRVSVVRGAGGLPNDSVLFCDEVATISRRFLASGPLGPPVPDDVVDAVVAGVLAAIAP